MIDVHVHLEEQVGRIPRQVAAVTRMSFDQTLDGVAHARATLMAGLTSVRDVAAYTPAIVALKRAQQQGTIVGPRMWVSGSALSPTGGHADFSTGFDYNLSKPAWTAGITDSPEEAVHHVRELHKMGADLVKIAPSGGVLSVGDDPEAQLMTDARIEGSARRIAHREPKRCSRVFLRRRPAQSS